MIWLALSFCHPRVDPQNCFTQFLVIQPLSLLTDPLLPPQPSTALRRGWCSVLIDPMTSAYTVLHRPLVRHPSPGS
ncbi:hypothetical protein JAAARDRAFT_646364 [Jaapia argillacea MUCL 33604]|uniref:Uncharacterized protein n=1 Tax=Jaapia argillacea MUCL 33604 TaxID=933084 RepID=A0A067PYA8_9AGAM|nr:hypothetical protein JAAARDRAFT_646364 [Jaapia argillacea MUCL 33604]